MLEETQREFGEGQRVRYYHVALYTSMKFWRKDFKKNMTPFGEAQATAYVQSPETSSSGNQFSDSNT